VRFSSSLSVNPFSIAVSSGTALQTEPAGNESREREGDERGGVSAGEETVLGSSCR
jgi:hypothetical protein